MIKGKRFLQIEVSHNCKADSIYIAQILIIVLAQDILSALLQIRC